MGPEPIKMGDTVSYCDSEYVAEHGVFHGIFHPLRKCGTIVKQKDGFSLIEHQDETRAWVATSALSPYTPETKEQRVKDYKSMMAEVARLQGQRAR